MRKLRRIESWTAALSAAAATGCIGALLLGVNPRSHVLMAAAAAATIGVAGLLVSLLLSRLQALRRAGFNLPLWLSAGVEEAGDHFASLRKRLEVLDQRLNIDESHLCSQYRLACTCWSFCGGTPHKNGLLEGAVLAPVRTPHRADQPLPQVRFLPVVHRSGMDNCPFRFESSCAPSACAEVSAQCYSTAAAVQQ